MARLPRLVVPGQAHLVVQRGHGGRPVFVDDADRQAFLAALHEAAAVHGVAVHAYALGDAEVWLLSTPSSTDALGRFVQAVGRRYVSTYNRRHGTAGTLWDGRFRSGVVEPGDRRLAALLLIDGLPGLTSAAHRIGSHPDPRIVDPPEFWQLGNTPFEREGAYRSRLASGVGEAEAAALLAAARGGWAVGSPAFLRSVGAGAQRPASPRRRGRPPRRRA